MAQRAFCEFCKEKKIKYFENEPMCQHTSFKTGGNADIFVKTADTSELSSVLNKLCELHIPYFIIGKGSNLLVSDKGIDGAVVSLSDMDKITVEGECITAGAGASLAAVCVAALKNSLTGLEQLYGIPASVGGALYMNAGAYGGEMS
ncbi:MAG: FAD-binding protein, partial [Clostridia bacterium]|nr:FAD-binding protein [Clostridia bacterium]